ncbi:type IX secretion system PorP/SprF family membrane protein [Flavobacterium cutihirudinis]|uniref:Type IX secretion system PorP/SprF family membrane protein n=1 Tax=Flavobacterium cutihirudinis TaxID=1265740 RepID=A0A3D9FVR3_9FLAO|nr:type IX secretion system membrane protein PorP/SprF [Flavobacterium cutihirudinis]RED24830.1 type IX secretion system PorP/SprF family membrane protein [Flavobacterium cutihirudinis]
MKKIIILLILLGVNTSYSQELNLPVFTQYLADNSFIISPTFAGIGDNLRIRANGLTQWVGIKDAPNNQSLYADLRVLDRSGVGISLYNDKNGNTRQTGAKISFAHHLILDYYTKQYLSFGISFNINNFKLDINNFNSGNGSNYASDPSITNNRSVSNNNFDTGVLYRNKGFYLNLNIANILNKETDMFMANEPALLRNYQVYTGYIFKAPYNDRVELEPSIYYQQFASDGRSSTDLNFKYRQFNRFEDYFWVGVSYRFLNDQFLNPLVLGPMAGFKKSNFYFGYSYQASLNQLGAYNSGTHVVTIGLDFLQGISNCPCTQSPVHY